MGNESRAGNTAFGAGVRCTADGTSGRRLRAFISRLPKNRRNECCVPEMAGAVMHRLQIVLALVAVLAGCTAGSSQPSEADMAPESSVGARTDPIPQVQDPKNLAGTPPCKLLTTAQLITYQIDQPGRAKDVLGSPGCEWEDDAHTREIKVYVDIGHDVLRNVNAQRATYSVFEVTQ